MASNQVLLNFGKNKAGIFSELKKRAEEMGMSNAKYCIMVLTRHIASGERFKVVDG